MARLLEVDGDGSIYGDEGVYALDVCLLVVLISCRMYMARDSLLLHLG